MPWNLADVIGADNIATMVSVLAVPPEALERMGPSVVWDLLVAFLDQRGPGAREVLNLANRSPELVDLRITYRPSNIDISQVLNALQSMMDNVAFLWSLCNDTERNGPARVAKREFILDILKALPEGFRRVLSELTGWGTSAPPKDAANALAERSLTLDLLHEALVRTAWRIHDELPYEQKALYLMPPAASKADDAFQRSDRSFGKDRDRDRGKDSNKRAAAGAGKAQDDPAPPTSAGAGKSEDRMCSNCNLERHSVLKCEKPCVFFNLGGCDRGDKCKLKHEIDEPFFRERKRRWMENQAKGGAKKADDKAAKRK